MRSLSTSDYDDRVILSCVAFPLYTNGTANATYPLLWFRFLYPTVATPELTSLAPERQTSGCPCSQESSARGPEVIAGRLSETEVQRPSSAYWSKTYHECCEGTLCCGCGKPLSQGEMEPVGLNQPQYHRLCQKCLWLAE